MPEFVEAIREESAFVAEYRANIPEARGPQVNTSGRALGRGTGTARGTSSERARGRGTRGTTLGRARGTARGSTARNEGSSQGTGRGTRRGRGLKWLLFGNNKKKTKSADVQEEVQTTQGAPDG